MSHSLYIAWKYVSFHKVRSLTLVACVTLIVLLPAALELLLEADRQAKTGHGDLAVLEGLLLRLETLKRDI